MNISRNLVTGECKAGDYVINLYQKEIEVLKLMILQLYKAGEFIEYNPMMEEMLKEIETVLMYSIEK